MVVVLVLGWRIWQLGLREISAGVCFCWRHICFRQADSMFAPQVGVFLKQTLGVMHSCRYGNFSVFNDVCIAQYLNVQRQRFLGTVNISFLVHDQHLRIITTTVFKPYIQKISLQPTL